MTEQEMLQTWCPHTQLVERDDRSLISSGAYEGFRPHGSAFCLGRRCSQWRWDDIPNPEYEREQTNSLSSFGSRIPRTIKSTTDGRCGLAGEP